MHLVISDPPVEHRAADANQLERRRHGDQFVTPAYGATVNRRSAIFSEPPTVTNDCDFSGSLHAQLLIGPHQNDER
jgi:hypothetical protein